MMYRSHWLLWFSAPGSRLSYLFPNTVDIKLQRDTFRRFPLRLLSRRWGACRSHGVQGPGLSGPVRSETKHHYVCVPRLTFTTCQSLTWQDGNKWMWNVSGLSMNMHLIWTSLWVSLEIHQLLIQISEWQPLHVLWNCASRSNRM